MAAPGLASRADAWRNSHIIHPLIVTEMELDCNEHRWRDQTGVQLRNMLRLLDVMRLLGTPWTVPDSGYPFYGKEPSKFNQDCTICRTCRLTRPDSIVSL